MARLSELVGARLVSPHPGVPPRAGGPPPRPGVLLDRDGTIIVDHGYVGTAERVEFIEGAAEAIARLNAAGVPVAVVSNQAGVARGLFDISAVEKVHRHIADRLAAYGAHIDRFFYCPYHPEGTVPEFTRTSVDRKPMPGMARAAAAALNLDLSRSWVVGDRPEDMGLAEAVGASGMYVGPSPCDRPGVWSFSSLAEATSFILERIRCDYHVPPRPLDSRRCRFPRCRTAPRPLSPRPISPSWLTRPAPSIPSPSTGPVRSSSMPTRGNLVFSCGNGGSAAVANHLQCDHLKGVRTGTDLHSRVVSLSSNVELLTAIANDVGYHDSFAYQLRAQSQPGDVLIVISSSGRSPNILHALQWATDNGLRTIALTGFDGGKARPIAEISVHVDSSNYGVVEDLHQSIMHAMAQYVRQSRMSADAIASSLF